VLSTEPGQRPPVAPVPATDGRALARLGTEHTLSRPYLIDWDTAGLLAHPGVPPVDDPTRV